MAAGARLADIGAFAQEAQAFAEQLSDTIQSVAGPDCKRFEATVSTEGNVDAVIRQGTREGIPLTQAGMPILRLEVRINLVPDHQREHLKVANSAFKVFAEGGRIPVFRYEYEAAMEHRDLPAAHVQFHGRHEELEELVASAGRPTTRSTAPGTARPNIADLHFPVGGSRFRPCLEDILEMLIYEFRIDPLPDRRSALDALAAGRVIWREKQLRTAVRDDPRTAADQLRNMRYAVLPPEPEPDLRAEQLRRL